MKKLLLVVVVCAVLGGCYAPREKARGAVVRPVMFASEALFKDEGWCFSGYTWRTEDSKFKLGMISSDILYDECQKDDRYLWFEKELKEHYHFGFFFSKEF